MADDYDSIDTKELFNEWIKMSEALLDKDMGEEMWFLLTKLRIKDGKAIGMYKSRVGMDWKP